MTATVAADESPPSTAATPLLAVSDLRCEFRVDKQVVRAVDGVGFEVLPGETLGVVGESGSGKSVTMLAMMGLVPMPPGRIASGEAWFAGRDLLKLPHREMRRLRGDAISMIFQDPMTSLNPYLRISRQLEEVLTVHRSMPRAERRRRVVDMLERVGIPDPSKRVRQYPHQLSGGMRQRVMIAMALLCEPKLLIADEPTTALDVTIQAQILRLFGKLKEAKSTAIVFITHDLGVVAGIADRVMVMYAGRVMERAPTPALFYRPAHPYTIGLLRSVPRVDDDARSREPIGTKRQRLIPIPGQPPDVSRLIPGCPFAPRCAFADMRCVQEAPPLRSLSLGHDVACWRAEDVQAMPAADRDAVAAAFAAGT